MIYKLNKNNNYITSTNTPNYIENNNLIPKSQSPKFYRRQFDSQRQIQSNKHTFYSPKKISIQQSTVPIKFYSPKNQKESTQSFKTSNPQKNMTNTILEKFNQLNNQCQQKQKNINNTCKINDQSEIILKLHSQIENLKRKITTYQQKEIKFNIKQKQYQQKIHHLQYQLAKQTALKSQILNELSLIKNMQYQVDQMLGTSILQNSFVKVVQDFPNKVPSKQQDLLKKIQQLEHEKLQLFVSLNKLNQSFKYQKIQLDMLKKKKNDIVNLQIKNLRLSQKNKQLQTSVQKCKIQLNKAKSPIKNQKVNKNFGVKYRKQSGDSIFSLSSDQSLQEKH